MKATVSILAVDDNADLLELVAIALREVAGVPVQCFDNPRSALAHFSDHPSECTLVISDFDMPGMTGAEMLRAMTAQRPGLATILFSGSSPEEIASRGIPSGCRFLPKPAGLSELIHAVTSLAEAA
jgi:DNA-binding NtrC family response regulator